MSRAKLALSVQYAIQDRGAPTPAFIETCAARALAGVAGELAIRIVDEAESAALNERFRGQRGPTNVLAFPAGDAPASGLKTRLLGDIVICAPVVAREAEEQHKPLEAHWAHMVIHGCLHLCGFDHDSEAGAQAMEGRERALLGELGIADPYRGDA